MAIAKSAKEILLAAAEANAEFPSPEVKRPLDQEQDLGNMLGWDENDLDSKALNSDEEPIREEYLAALARDNAQLLLNALFSLPTERIREDLCAKLPVGTYVVPREKPLPKPKVPTKWEQYAKAKGIVKKKNVKGADGRNPRLKWDDAVQDWIPTYGYKRAQAEAEKNWMMEIKDNADPMEDPFEKAIEEKREKIAKNELQRLKNVARSKNVKVPAAGLPSATGLQSSKDAASVALKATASLGKFQGKLSSTALQKKAEKDAKKAPGKKRKFDPLVPVGSQEKERDLKVLDSIMSKKPRLDVSKAAAIQMNKDEMVSSEAKKSKPSSKKNSKGKGKRAGKSHFKNRSGKAGKGGKGAGRQNKAGGKR